MFRSKAPPDSLPLTADIIRAYQTAYSGLMVALRGELTEAQIVDAVRMMADITRLFAPRAMASPAEAEYWAKCAVVLIAQQELECIRERVAEPPSTPGLSTTMRRLHDQLRRRQLEKALSRLLKQLNELEHAIGFLDPPCLPLG